MFSSYLLVSKDIEILGSFSKQLILSLNLVPWYLSPLITVIFISMTNLTHSLQMPKFSSPILSGFPSPTYWDGQTFSLIIRRPQISLVLKILFFLPPPCVHFNSSSLQLELHVYWSLTPNTCSLGTCDSVARFWKQHRLTISNLTMLRP